MSDTLNPCISCGACCAHFRVSFYWAEADDAGGLAVSYTHLDVYKRQWQE